jgi:hypothetical protein
MSSGSRRSNKKFVVSVICEDNNCEMMMYNMFTGRAVRLPNAIYSKVTAHLVFDITSHGYCLFTNNFCYELFSTDELKHRLGVPAQGVTSNTYNNIISAFPELKR